MKFTTALFVAGSAMMVAAQTNDTDVPEFKTESLLALDEFCKAHTNLCKYVVINTPTFKMLAAEDATDDAEEEEEDASEPLEKRTIARHHRHHRNSTEKARKHHNGKRDPWRAHDSFVYHDAAHLYTWPFDFLKDRRGQGSGADE